MSELSTLTACSHGHVIHYPQVLDDKAIEAAQELAFCAMCECGTVHFVVIWAGDGARVMASGDAGLFERFEAQTWPESIHTDEHGAFFYRTVPNTLVRRKQMLVPVTLLG
ncbi:hypothetical protein Franean1_4772 [Parafrankia sp. EAN1pec]|uniref:hypothetical protein n=1 Tax=Parafrankia sp. (strain EAN1pec) TaxID=298653 RepID=UPI0000541DA1|nr:hypothetical protein Franean1_4772 [Frankia sp. EAN1pec]